MPDLLLNSHLRIVTVNEGVEIHLQSMVFRAIEFDEPGFTVQFSFVPIRPGTYVFSVGRNPAAQGIAVGTPGQCEVEFCARGEVIVQ
jgi:hypothetical protein